MKKYISILILLLFSGTNIVAQSFSDDNFIYTVTPTKAVNEENLKTLTKDEKHQNVTYFDGLGRPVQTIAIGQGGNGEDIVTPIEYDGFGRQEKEYLPFSLPNSNNDYQRIEHETAVNAVKTFYKVNKYDVTLNPFSQKKLENSPLNRVLKQAAPGNDWAMDNGHEIKMDYQTNNGSEVRLFEAATTWDATLGLYDIAFWDNGHYDKNELYKTIVYDENTEANPVEEDGSTVEFKNKEGQVVLKRTYEAGINHDTYYVYDEYGNLTYVIPPKADGVITKGILDNLCYQYKYDNRNRRVEKKLPGKQWEFIVYDRLNRVVATGPANSPFQEDSTVGWLITKYDVFSRVVYTGWSNTSSNETERYTMQKAQNNTAILHEKKANGTIDGILVYYSNTVAPTSFKLLTVTYYDDHSFPNAANVPAVSGVTLIPASKAMVTGTWARVPTIASATMGETITMYYNNKNVQIRNYSTNHLGGGINYNYTPDFTGKIAQSKTRQVFDNKGVTNTFYENFFYSQQERLLKHTHQVDFAYTHLQAENIYDDLGQLAGKNVGNVIINGTTKPFQKMKYNYNIRGWLTEINNIEKLQQDNDPEDLFALKINYNKVEGNTNAAKALYNGNIAETFWATASNGAGIIRGYGYQYDQLNRLKDAIFQSPKLADNKNYFGENMEYDKNGNITKLQRKFMAGVYSNPYADDMDDLDYFYADDSNQLMKVTDKTNNPQGFRDDSNGYNDIADDYAYDDNGNMIKDQNKNITEITYNHLNLPKKITFATGNTIVYIYNATGEKVEKIVTENGMITNTKYLRGGYQYKNDILQFFSTPEGYVRNRSNDPKLFTFVYNYNHKDHLGNIRVNYGPDFKTNLNEIQGENHFYPFGLKQSGYSGFTLSEYRYRYNGKEWQDELGLNMTAMDYRQYDDALGRFNSMDALSEQESSLTPYRFAYNNPVKYSDPSGLFETRAQDAAYGREGSFFHSKFLNQNVGHWSDQYRSGSTQDPPVGVDAANGATHSDADGTWVYDESTTTWVGQNGSKDIGNTIELDNVNVKGYKSKYVPSGEYGPYTPDGLAITFSGSIEIAYTAHTVNFSLVANEGGKIGGFLTFGTGVSTSRFGGGIGASLDVIDTYGGATVFEGLKDYALGGSLGFKYFGGSHYQSALVNKGQFIVNDKAGVVVNSLFLNLNTKLNPVPSSGASLNVTNTKRLF